MRDVETAGGGERFRVVGGARLVGRVVTGRRRGGGRGGELRPVAEPVELGGQQCAGVVE